MAVMEGSLSKWTNVMKGWQYRWFVLDENSGLLSYYTSKEKMMRGVRRGCVRLKGAVIGIDDEDDSTFTITVDHKTFHFQARDADEREKWVRALEETICRHESRIRWDTSRSLPTIRDFDNKVSEADAYLQLMIEQTKKLEERLSTMPEGEDRVKCQVILEHANTMLDNIKHSIVLLQIAKNTAHPVNGIYHPLIAAPAGSEALEEATVIGQDKVEQGIEYGSECIERRNNPHAVVGASGASLAVPDMSYSSSEGEDDFFDAKESLAAVTGSQVTTPTGLGSIEDQAALPAINGATNVINKAQSNTSASKSIQNWDSSADIDYDLLYDNSDDESDVELESQGSVIRHLLSQVKIGMDLTKVVLPTFILERRSLLEMYADYFAHPDIFVRIADLKDPKERMIQVVRWYLASYHAGRKSAVAKKPYNPILGEIFRCTWDVEPQPANETVPDGPIPWCKKNQLSFIAEQVSHHPPISAFYAEHYDKRITFNAHIYTKSKFLGLSICVYNIGEGVVSVLNHDEDYIVTFPNGYGRSILTVPWIELGGNVSITCPRTGYYANVEFLTKPFYGNRKNRVNADVYGPDKKAFLNIQGEWNGVMEAKWSEKEVSEFVNVTTLPILKKQVRPIKEQEPNESRRLWKDVTAGLKFNNIEKATNAKSELEQKQRDEAKSRKETDTEWETKLFDKVGEDHWVFKKPLSLRLGKPRVICRESSGT